MLLDFTGCQHGVCAAFWEFLVEHAARYPAMEVLNLYKSVHQAALGLARGTIDTAAARVWLEREINSLRIMQTDELVRKVLRPDGQLARINLRPDVASGHGVE